MGPPKKLSALAQAVGCLYSHKLRRKRRVRIFRCVWHPTNRHLITCHPDRSSPTLTPVLLEHGLADEVLLLVYPILLGTGKRFVLNGLIIPSGTVWERIAIALS